MCPEWTVSYVPEWAPTLFRPFKRTESAVGPAFDGVWCQIWSQRIHDLLTLVSDLVFPCTSCGIVKIPVH
jgi:hypothetical protein